MGDIVLRFFLALQVLVAVPALSFAKTPTEAKGQVTIVVHPVFNGQPLRLAEQHYVNEYGDTLSVDLFRFYMTNITVGANGADNLCRSCSHLVDAEEPGTCTFTVAQPEGSFDRLVFTLGVDSIANTSGANEGDLDPIKGMYWAWNTGYIMAKIEGRAKVCHTLHNVYEFHIGGYMPPNNVARQVELSLPHTLTVKKEGPTATIHIKADVAAWFKGIDLAKTNSIVMPGKEAMQMADRYSKMFSVE